MFGYIARRLVSAFLVIVVTSMMVFALFYLGPSNPAGQICEQSGRCTEEKLALIEKGLGLDQPVVTAYGQYVSGLVNGRTIAFGGEGSEVQCPAPCLGISYNSRQPVWPELIDRYPATLSLAIGGAVLFLGTGVALGVVAARFRGSFIDRGLVTFSLLISSVPYYIFALLAWIFLTLQWSIFPDTAYVPLTQDPVRWFTHMLLPWLVIGLTMSTGYARYSRGQMVEVLGDDYVRTAKAKGLHPRKVLFKHALRAAVVPIVTIFGLDLAALLSGTIVTEQIFGIDGIGRYTLQALSPIDFPIVTASVLLTAVLIVLANLIVDVIYSMLDPRVRLS